MYIQGSPAWVILLREDNLYNFVLRAVHKLCHLGRGEGVSPNDELLNRPYLTKKTTRGEGIKAFETT